MRVAHITDLHVEVPPSVGQLFSKRALGAVNLYLLGRSAHFSPRSVEALVHAVVRAEPELVVCTGDLTATATPQEFERAAALLAPITDRFPFFTLPGNHDVYTGESAGRFRKWFGTWANEASFPATKSMGGIDFVAFDTARAGFLSRGYADPTHLAALEAVLVSGTAPAVLMVHYPLRDRRGEPYGPYTRNLENAEALEAILARAPRVVAVLHGHEHHGYRTVIPRPGAPLPSFDPGASGYAHLPARHRTAHFNVYDLSEAGDIHVERFAFDGDAFVPEPGGAYATAG